MNQEPRITLERYPGTVRVRAGRYRIARSDRALLLREKGYPDVLYLPPEDVAMDRLLPSGTTTLCPFKGEATYYSVRTTAGARRDCAWSYREPLPGMEALAGLIAFDGGSVEVRREGEDPD